MEYYDRYLLFNGITEEERRILTDTFMHLVKVSLWSMNDTQCLNKNPPHTRRVKTLLKMSPNVKFICLKRNPYMVFKSIHSFFANTTQPLCLQDVANEQIEANFVKVYHHLFYKYEEEKYLIPEGNLVEMRFEDFEKDTFGTMKNIYGSLDLPGFKESKTDIGKYLSKERDYKEDQYEYEDRTVRLVEENWGVTLKEWGYNL